MLGYPRGTTLGDTSTGVTGGRGEDRDVVDSEDMGEWLFSCLFSCSQIDDVTIARGVRRPKGFLCSFSDRVTKTALSQNDAHNRSRQFPG